MIQEMQQSPLYKPLLGVALVTGLILLVPLIAMRFTDQVNWTLSDFVVAAILLCSAGTTMVLGVRHSKTTARRVAVVAVVMCVLLVIWAQLAVGLFT